MLGCSARVKGPLGVEVSMVVDRDYPPVPYVARPQDPSLCCWRCHQRIDRRCRGMATPSAVPWLVAGGDVLPNRKPIRDPQHPPSARSQRNHQFHNAHGSRPTIRGLVGCASSCRKYSCWGTDPWQSSDQSCIQHLTANPLRLRSRTCISSSWWSASAGIPHRGRSFVSCCAARSWCLLGLRRNIFLNQCLRS